MFQVKTSGSDSKGRHDRERLQAGKQFITRPIMVTWRRCRACMKVTAAEVEKEKWMLETTGGAMANELEAEERDINWQVSTLKAGLTARLCPRQPVWSSGLGLDIRGCFFLISLLPAGHCLSRLSGPHLQLPWPDFLPSPATTSDPMTVLGCNGQGLFSKPQAPRYPPAPSQTDPLAAWSQLCSHRLVHRFLTHRT